MGYPYALIGPSWIPSRGSQNGPRVPKMRTNSGTSLRIDPTSLSWSANPRRLNKTWLKKRKLDRRRLQIASMNP